VARTVAGSSLSRRRIMPSGAAATSTQSRFASSPEKLDLRQREARLAPDQFRLPKSPRCNTHTVRGSAHALISSMSIRRVRECFSGGSRSRAAWA
jgi:hypothetical protein